MIYYSLLPDNYTDNDYAQLYGKLRVFLPDFRKEAADRLCSPKEKCASALAYLLLCYGLKNEGLYEDTTGFSPVFSYDAMGKPYIEELKNCYFNLSHCKNAVACAILPVPVGVDILDVRKVSPAIKNKFSVPTLNDEEFCRLFSRYEAYVKLTGEGIRRSYAKCGCLSNEFLAEGGIKLCTYEIKQAAIYLSAACMNYSIEDMIPNEVSFEALFSK